METTFAAVNIEDLAADQALHSVLDAHAGRSTCVTCSFQAEDMIVLQLIRERIPAIPVLFLETGYHFAETCQYRDRMTREWSLNLVNVSSRKTVEEQESEFGVLYQRDPARCCQMRKVEPLFEALEPYELWFTGLRREQSPTRRNLKKIEEHRLPSGKKILKVNLLADWTWGQVWQHTSKHGLSYLPQYDQGYLSIGCQPCTSVPDDASNPRSGRWGGKKLECGIHTFSESGQ